MTPLSVIVLISGCARISGDSYCDITSPILFDSEQTVDFLINNDRAMLTDVIVHNETHARICSSD